MTDQTPSVFDEAEPEAPSLRCPSPGIYQGVPFEEYVNWAAINHSKLCRVDKSPLNFLAEEAREKTQALSFGSLVHAGRLEPESIFRRYAVMPDFANHPDNVSGKGAKQEQSTSPQTAWCKAKVAEFRDAARLEGKEVVTQDQWDRFIDAMAAIETRKAVVEAVNSGQLEVSIVWHDRRTGLRCKARIDCASKSLLMDLKTTDDSQNNEPLGESFDWTIGKYSYHTQAAWYIDGWFALTGERLPFWFAVVTTQRPLQCIFAPLGEQSVVAGRKKNNERMDIVAKCKQSGEWPGYENPELFELPEKYLPEIEL